MFTKASFTKDHFSPGLVDAVGKRLESGEYSDAIIAGIKYLTDVLRQKGGCEGDGATLVGLALGGNPPAFAINKLETASEKDEQRGIEQLIRGIYMGIRNPRTHEMVKDTEEFCVRTLIIVDTMLQYLNRAVIEFDVEKFVGRVFDPHFVVTDEYAQSLIAEVPQDKLFEVFRHIYARRADGQHKVISLVIKTIYGVLSEPSLKEMTEHIGNDLRAETDDSKLAQLFGYLKPSAWPLLQNDVRLRIENIIIQSCKKGSYDIYRGLTAGALGTWGNTFGRYFVRRDEFASALITRSRVDWYSQNYVAKYFLYSLPSIINSEALIEEAAEALAYAAMSNQAKLVRSKLLEVSSNYPAQWKAALKVAIAQRTDDDAEYGKQILDILQ